MDARIGGPAPAGRRSRAVRRAADSSAPSPLDWPATILALGSMALGIGASAVVLNPAGDGTTSGEIGLAVLIWVIIGIINVANARRR